MTDVTLMTPSEINELMTRIDGDGDVNAFTGFELLILMSHLKETGQLEFTSSWYQNIFNTMVEADLLDQDGNILVSIYSIYWQTASDATYRRTDRGEDSQ